GSAGLVRPVAPGDTEPLCSLASMPWQRPNIGSRVTREGHARFWERPRVKLPRATRHVRPSRCAYDDGRSTFSSGKTRPLRVISQLTCFRARSVRTTEELGQQGIFDSLDASCLYLRHVSQVADAALLQRLRPLPRPPRLRAERIPELRCDRT